MVKNNLKISTLRSLLLRTANNHMLNHQRLLRPAERQLPCQVLKFLEQTKVIKQLKMAKIYISNRSKSFTSLIADLHQDKIRVSLNYSIKTLVVLD